MNTAVPRYGMARSGASTDLHEDVFHVGDLAGVELGQRIEAGFFLDLRQAGLVDIRHDVDVDVLLLGVPRRDQLQEVRPGARPGCDVLLPDLEARVGLVEAPR